MTDLAQSPDQGPSGRGPSGQVPPGQGQAAQDPSDQRQAPQGQAAEAVPLLWRPSALLRRLAAVAVLTLSLAAVLGRAELVVVAAPLLWWLAAADRSRPPAARLATAVKPDRCGEGDTVEVTITVTLDTPAALVAADLTWPPGTRIRRCPPLPQRTRAGCRLRWEVQPQRWGRWSVGPARLRFTAAGGLLQAELRRPAGQLTVLPAPAPVAAAVLPARLPLRTGDHSAPVAGAGIEFEGLRPYQLGDRPHQVNWAATARRRRLYVTTRQDERSFDLVLLVDAFVRVGPPGCDSLDLSVRGTVGLADAHLRRGERVGVVVVGGLLRGLAPGVGGHHLHRVAEAILDVRLNDSYVDPDVSRLPRTVLPPGALAVLFSPLLDERARLAALDLRQRGHPVVIVDVLCDTPRPGRRSDVDRLALPLWRLDRAADRFELGRWGVPVLPWDGSVPLQAALGPLYRRPVPGWCAHGG